MSRGPLANVRVLDLTTVGPGARCAALLADLGADVVKVGPPPAAGRIVPADWAYAAGRGMRRIGIDLKDPAGRDAVLRLAGRCDVVIEGFRPGVAARLGLGYDDVRTVRDDVVYASLTGYGQQGPYAEWAGHDLDYQAVSGALAAAGRRADGGPALPGATFADSAGGGMHAAVSICAALVDRAATGRGAHLDVAAVDGMLHLMSLHLDETLATGTAPSPDTSILHGRYACYDVYRCRDGRWLAVAAIEPRFFANLLRELGLERWIGSERDDAVQDELRAAIGAALATRDRDDWVAALGPKDTCVAPVLDLDEVALNEHVRARRSVVDVTVRNRLMPQTARTIAGAPRPAREIGTAANETDPWGVLGDAGLGNDEIQQLLTAEVVT